MPIKFFLACFVVLAKCNLAAASILSMGGEGFQWQLQFKPMGNSKSLPAPKHEAGKVYLPAEYLDKILEVRISLPKGQRSKDIKIEGFDARMPAHNHGMNTKPKISALKNSEGWVVQGFCLHMSGEWQLSLQYKKEGRIYFSTREVTLAQLKSGLAFKAAQP